ncbi:MAG TPA: hypothetical protein VGQ53_18725 [Chitinophagaceae bacterium]|nr:hypothetical protein [Chitinophagaceae bacterium]
MIRTFFHCSGTIDWSLGIGCSNGTMPVWCRDKACLVSALYQSIWNLPHKLLLFHLAEQIGANTFQLARVKRMTYLKRLKDHMIQTFN